MNNQTTGTNPVQETNTVRFTKGDGSLHPLVNGLTGCIRDMT